jgi:hypothetical protein
MCQAFRYYEELMEVDISPLEMPSGLNSKSVVSTRLEGLCDRVDWHKPEQVMAFRQMGDRTTYALTISMTGEILRRSELWIRVLKDHLERNPFALLSIEVPPDTYPEDLDPLWCLARDHHHPADRDYTVTHTPYRSFFLFSRANGLLWKWPDPRESSPLKLHDDQKVDCGPVCLVAAREDKIPGWFFEHLRQRFVSPPEIRIWQPPGEEHSESEKIDFG